MRSKRGKGIRRRVEPRSAVPGNWQEFLRIDDSKTELCFSLASNVAEIETNKHLITTQGYGVLSSNQEDVSTLVPCTHEKADTRILLYLKDAVRHGYSNASIRTVDTDVVVLAITPVNRLNLSELWVTFGLRRASGLSLLTKLPTFSVPTDVKPCRCFMLSLDMTRYPVLGAEEKKLHGSPGPPMKILRQHSLPWVIRQT